MGYLSPLIDRAGVINCSVTTMVLGGEWRWLLIALIRSATTSVECPSLVPSAPVFHIKLQYILMCIMAARAYLGKVSHSSRTASTQRAPKISNTFVWNAWKRATSICIFILRPEEKDKNEWRQNYCSFDWCCSHKFHNSNFCLQLLPYLVVVPEWSFNHFKFASIHWPSACSRSATASLPGVRTYNQQQESMDTQNGV